MSKIRNINVEKNVGDINFKNRFEKSAMKNCKRLILLFNLVCKYEIVNRFLILGRHCDSDYFERKKFKNRKKQEKNLNN
jgi:hypothetical protein